MIAIQRSLKSFFINAETNGPTFKAAALIISTLVLSIISLFAGALAFPHSLKIGTVFLSVGAAGISFGLVLSIIQRIQEAQAKNGPIVVIPKKILNKKVAFSDQYHFIPINSLLGENAFTCFREVRSDQSYVIIQTTSQANQLRVKLDDLPQTTQNLLSQFNLKYKPYHEVWRSYCGYLKKIWKARAMLKPNEVFYDTVKKAKYYLDNFRPRLSFDPNFILSQQHAPLNFDAELMNMNQNLFTFCSDANLSNQLLESNFYLQENEFHILVSESKIVFFPGFERDIKNCNLNDEIHELTENSKKVFVSAAEISKRKDECTEFFIQLKSILKSGEAYQFDLLQMIIFRKKSESSNFYSDCCYIPTNKGDLVDGYKFLSDEQVFLAKPSNLRLRLDAAPFWGFENKTILLNLKHNEYTIYRKEDKEEFVIVLPFNKKEVKTTSLTFRNIQRKLASFDRTKKYRHLEKENNFFVYS